jgi:hypothetical protein
MLAIFKRVIRIEEKGLKGGAMMAIYQQANDRRLYSVLSDQKRFLCRNVLKARSMNKTQ